MIALLAAPPPNRPTPPPATSTATAPRAAPCREVGLGPLPCPPPPPKKGTSPTWPHSSPPSTKLGMERPWGQGRAPPPPLGPWGAHLHVGFWWMGGGGLNDPPGWAHLFVHLNVQPVGHLIVLWERAGRQWGCGGGSYSRDGGGGTRPHVPGFATLPMSCSTRMGLILGRNIHCGVGGRGEGIGGSPITQLWGGWGGGVTLWQLRSLTDHHVVPLDFGFLRRQLLTFQLQATKIKHKNR